MDTCSLAMKAWAREALLQTSSSNFRSNTVFVLAKARLKRWYEYFGTEKCLQCCKRNWSEPFAVVVLVLFMLSLCLLVHAFLSLLESHGFLLSTFPEFCAGQANHLDSKADYVRYFSEEVGQVRQGGA